jgi:hypothetical protein
MQKYTDVVTSARSGAAKPDARVTVKTYPAGVVATIYSDDGVTTQDNPITTDSNGEFYFYAADGEYTLTVSGTGITERTIGPIILHDPTDADDYMLATDVSFTPSGTGATAETVQAAFRRFVFPEMYGAVGDGVTDDSTAWTNALARIASGGTLMCSPGATYHFTSQVTVDGPDNSRICIQGYGAEITTAGAISGLKITGGSSTGGVSIYGLKINHRGNSDATYGFDIIGAWRARLYECFVEAHGVSATYAAYHIANTTAADTSTGSFWTLLNSCGCRKRSGSDSGDITYGVLIEGAANATSIIGGQWSSTTTGVKVQCHSGQTYLANGLVVDGAHFETYTTAIHVEGAATSNIGGHRFSNNRFEDGTTVYSYTGTTTQASVPPFMFGNHYVSNAGTYLNNPNSIIINNLDMSITPSIQATLTQPSAFKLKATTGTEHGLIIEPGGASRGLLINDSSGVANGQLIALAGNKFRVASQSGTSMYLANVRGISASTSVLAENLRGTVTFAGAATAAVTFGTAETNTSYFVAINGSANETFWVTSKATGGFTLNSSNATSTAVVDWILIR